MFFGIPLKKRAKRRAEVEDIIKGNEEVENEENRYNNTDKDKANDNENLNQNSSNRKETIYTTTTMKQVNGKAEDSTRRIQPSTHNYSAFQRRTTEDKNKILIFADQQGKNLQRSLQHLVGEKYIVQYTWKPGASMKDILTQPDDNVLSLSKQRLHNNLRWYK